mmetsp:Transcript_94822/g.265526  ORF Transcript_94822/g.265526 Transcript_94822/m.265526 type:complete len:276 (+) Transcript_94822:1260-2087(+)
MPLALRHNLLDDRPVLEQGDVARAVDVVQLQLDRDLSVVRVLEDVVLGAEQLAPLALAHAQQRLLDDAARGAQGVRPDVVVEGGRLLDDAAILRDNLQGQVDLAALLRVHPSLLPLLDQGLDAPRVAEEVVLGDPADELHLEDEDRAGRDGRRLPRLAVGELGLDDKPRQLPLGHRRDAQVPAPDDLALPEGELDRLPAIPRRVELLSALERPDVVHGDLVARLRFPPRLGRPLPQDLLLHAVWQLRRRRVLVVVASIGHAPCETGLHRPPGEVL